MFLGKALKLQKADTNLPYGHDVTNFHEKFV